MATPIPPPQAETASPRPTSQRASPLLLVVLAVALVAMGAWWYSQTTRDTTGETVTPAPLTSQPMVDPSEATARQPARSDSERTRTAVADRAPRPLADNPLPRYPATALRTGAEASVVLSIAVDANGVPTDIAVVERQGARDHALDRAAVETARQWRFEPAIRDGRPVEATVRLPVEFRRG